MDATDRRWLMVLGGLFTACAVLIGAILGRAADREWSTPSTFAAADTFKPTPPPAKPAAPPRDLSGIYSVVGAEKDPYSGSATVHLVAPDVYLVKWTLTTGEFRGAGMLVGDVLSIAWTFPVKADGDGPRGVMLGTHQMRLQPNGNLHGHWASLPGHGSVRPENWTRLAGLPKVSEH